MVINCKKPCKKKRSTMLTVEQMVDIALGTPEIGAVNFNVLHALIHVIIQQLNIQKCLVEFKGYDSDRMEGIILSAKPGPILKLSEYMIDVSEGKPCPGKEKPSKIGKEDDECKDEGKETPKKPPCECMKKKKAADDEKEKSDKGKDELDADEKKASEKKVIKKELPSNECEEIEEPEPKKIKEAKKSPKPCPCKAAKEQDICADESLKAVPSSYYGSDSEGTCQTIVRVEPVGEKCDSWRSRPALAHESMIKLEEKVAMLQDAFEALEQMPTNEELKKRTQGSGCVSTPVKDLWQIYNLNKRVESCEGTIEKLASMIEDLVKETCNFREAMLVIADAVDEIECADQTARSCCAALQGRDGANATAAFVGNSKDNKMRSKSGETQTVTFVETEIKPSLEKKETDPQPQSQPQPQPQPQPPKSSKFSGPGPFPCKGNAPGPKQPPSTPEPGNPAPQEAEPPTSEAPPREEPPAQKPEKDQQERNPPAPSPTPAPTPAPAPAPTPAPAPAPGPAPMAASFGTSDGCPPPAPQMGGIGPEFYKMSIGEKFCVLKEHVDCLLCQVKNFSENLPVNQIKSKLCALVSMQKQLDAIDKEWRAFLESFAPNGISGLSKDITNMKLEIENLNNLVSKLITAKQDAENTLQNIAKETDYLMKAKADLELVQDQLAEKADAALVNRKVSHDQFDAACDDLTRGLDEALKRLMEQEAMWNEAMEELQKDLENKLDKNEIMPLKEFINKKLKCLQEKLKQLAQLRKEAEAAGAKSRILRNLNCIACDADVVMKMDNKTNFPMPSMAPSKSLKPMLSFELDQVRKAMKKGPPCRGGNHVDEALLDVQKKAAGIPLTTREAVDSKMSKFAHFCNRYCGGSHTITTPQQRVTRIGHFLTEFGPQAMAIFNQDFIETKSIQQGMTPSGVITPNVDLSKPC